VGTNWLTVPMPEHPGSIWSTLQSRHVPGSKKVKSFLVGGIAASNPEWRTQILSQFWIQNFSDRIRAYPNSVLIRNFDLFY
jgi:hypothetical protein